MPQQIDFDPSVDYYKALGVSQSASADDIKRAYRKLAKANHPDSTGGDKAKESRFKDISNAYDVLGDSKKRALYDQIRANPGMQQGFPGGMYTSQSGGGVYALPASGTYEPAKSRRKRLAVVPGTGSSPGPSGVKR